LYSEYILWQSLKKIAANQDFAKTESPTKWKNDLVKEQYRARKPEWSVTKPLQDWNSNSAEAFGSNSTMGDRKVLPNNKLLLCFPKRTRSQSIRWRQHSEHFLNLPFQVCLASTE
jgi:hypothetical protein